MRTWGKMTGDDLKKSELPSSMKAAIQYVRQQLLDIGKRNRLIHTPVGNRRSKQILVVDELSDEIFKILALEKKNMSFLGVPDDVGTNNAEDAAAAQGIYIPPEDDEDVGGVAVRHVDLKLQTLLTRETLQKKLLSIHLDAKSIEDEQGVNVLYLGIGFLKWFENEKSDIERFAPLILLPVELSRDSVRGKFRLSFREQDLAPNISLQALLNNDFQISLPDLPEAEGWLPSDYFNFVEECIKDQPRWQIERDTILLGFYSFAKFLMWRDLDPDKWPAGTGFDGNDLIQKLLVDGFEEQSPLIESNENLDERFVDLKKLGHVMDADASQAQVIETVRNGRNLVVQGPPGTGKSQTIANIIATAVQDGKRVLFVAEKMAALDVVQQRLEECHLGPVCLELHSRMANKRLVLEELDRTLKLGAPKAVEQSEYQLVERTRDRLNALSQILHEPDPVNGQTAYRTIGLLVQLREKGVLPPNFRLSEAPNWVPDEADAKRNAVKLAAELTDKFGSEFDHPWRGVERRLTPMERTRLEPQLHDALASIQALRQTCAEVCTVFEFQKRLTTSAVKEMTEQLDALGSMPKYVKPLLESDVLKTQFQRARDLLDLVKKGMGQREALADRITEIGLDADWVSDAQVILAHGGRLFRIFNRAYREAAARLNAVCIGPTPSEFAKRKDLVNSLVDLNRTENELKEHDAFGQQAFGALWAGRKTDFASLSPAMSWLSEEALRLNSIDVVAERVASMREGADVAEVTGRLKEQQRQWKICWHEISAALDYSSQIGFQSEDIEDVSLDELEVRLRHWTLEIERLEDWNGLHAAAAQLSHHSLDPIRDGLATGGFPPSEALDQFEFACAEAVWGDLCEKNPELDNVDGDERTELVERFGKIDSALKALAAQEISLSHYRSLPRGGAGQMGILKGEIGKKRRHMALRKLMDSAGEAISKIKPVFLMSPLSVAQYLRPGGVSFDLLVMDEASQIRPEDALGAILRSKQIVVVGDRHQLPPTSFFSRMTEGVDQDSEAEEETPQAAQVGDMESVLTLCAARSIPGETLRWHYRSKHPSLIAVSNQTFYENRLVFPPSPELAGSAAGLTYQHVDGVYDRGGSRANLIEAKAVAKAVLQHARERAHLSLGVVTFSVSQRDAIQNELEFLRAENPELEVFFSEGSSTQFFVKNLENVQGDERDTIFISVCYGRDADGYMSQSFGPVSSGGGERRLNVLFTRAKLSCQIFSSLSHQDIRDDVSKNIGPKVFKRYLKYAETGEIDLPRPTGGEMDSPFEEAVASAIRRSGYAVEAQVGSAGFLIDLAVYDPDNDGRFLLAVECDGATYHSSRWARERDRLRQQVLESKGWVFHRIWSTDWFRKPDAELDKLLIAIDSARNPTKLGAMPQLMPVVERSLALESVQATRYAEARFTISQRQDYELHEAPRSIIRQCIQKIVEIEGPIHIEEIGRRLSRLWGYQRAGQRIQARVKEVVISCLVNGDINHAEAQSTDFVIGKNVSDVPIRNRKHVSASTLRRVDNLPPTEIRQAILKAIDENISLSEQEVATAVARMIGFKSTSAEFRIIVDRELESLCEIGLLVSLTDGFRRNSDDLAPTND